MSPKYTPAHTSSHFLEQQAVVSCRSKEMTLRRRKPIKSDLFEAVRWSVHSENLCVSDQLLYVTYLWSLQSRGHYNKSDVIRQARQMSCYWKQTHTRSQPLRCVPNPPIWTTGTNTHTSRDSGQIHTSVLPWQGAVLPLGLGERLSLLLSLSLHLNLDGHRVATRLAVPARVVAAGVWLKTASMSVTSDVTKRSSLSINNSLN